MREELIIFAITFTLLFLGRLLLYIQPKSKNKKKKGRPKKKDKSGISIEMKYLSSRFKLKETNLNNKKIAVYISLFDALIISTTVSVILNVTKSLVLQMFLGILMIFTLIYIVYEIFGRILKKRGYDKDEL